MRTNESIDLIGRLETAAVALASVDLGGLSDAAIEESLSVVSVALCRLEMLRSRLAIEARNRCASRGEFPWFDVNPMAVRQADLEISYLDGLRLVS
jgi:hypothetical protein